MTKPAAVSRELRTTLAERVRMERARMQISQEELGDLCRLSRVHIGAIERAEVGCSLDVLAQLARALGLEASDLLRGRSPPFTRSTDATSLKEGS